MGPVGPEESWHGFKKGTRIRGAYSEEEGYYTGVVYGGGAKYLWMRRDDGTPGSAPHEGHKDLGWLVDPKLAKHA